MVTRTKTSLVETATGRPLDEKLGDIINAADYGASSAGSTVSNTLAINNALAVADNSTGFVIVHPGVSFTEADLNLTDGLILIVLSNDGTITYLTKDQGTTLPVTKGGLVIKSKGNTGVLLRSTDYGLSAEPILQFIDATNGDLAAVEFKFAEITELASDPAAPSANKARLYTKDNGAGKTQLVVRFPTGAVQVIATEP
jgi:hypothetical protein